MNSGAIALACLPMQSPSSTMHAMISAEPALPTLPDRFTRIELLGEGSQALTVGAYDEETGREVAIKVLDLGRVRDWKAFDRFERECSVLQSLDHPGVPTYFEQIRDDDEGRYLLVMERVQGRTLADDLGRGRRRSEAQLFELLGRLLDVLEYLHGLHPSVIHRDIKPGNVMVRPDGSVALVDFGGVAKVFRPEGASTVVGTFGYMAPEQLYGRATPASDLYALGATLAAVAAGEDAEKLPRRGLEVDLSEAINPGRLRTVLSALLRADPDERPGSVAEVRALIRGDSLSGAPSLPSVVPASEHRVASLQTRTSTLAVWRELAPQQKTIAMLGLWAVIGFGVVTKALFVSVVALGLFPLVLGIMHGLSSED